MPSSLTVHYHRPARRRRRRICTRILDVGLRLVPALTDANYRDLTASFEDSADLQVVTTAHGGRRQRRRQGRRDVQRRRRVVCALLRPLQGSEQDGLRARPSCDAPPAFFTDCRECVGGCKAAFICLLRHGLTAADHKACLDAILRRRSPPSRDHRTARSLMPSLAPSSWSSPSSPPPSSSGAGAAARRPPRPPPPTRRADPSSGSGHRRTLRCRRRELGYWAAARARRFYKAAISGSRSRSPLPPRLRRGGGGRRAKVLKALEAGVGRGGLHRRGERVALLRGLAAACALVGHLRLRRRAVAEALRAGQGGAGSTA